MKTNKLELLTLALLVFTGIVSGSARVNVTRLLSNDKFTNPNQTAVNKCRSSGQGSSYLDICKRFDSTDTRAVCSSPSSCCEMCQCEAKYATYLPHLGKCVSVSELNWDVFGQGSNGCGPRLEMKGKGNGDDDGRDDDKDDDSHKHKDPCKVKPWNLPLINLQNSSIPKIKFCQKKDVESCDFVRVQYLGYGGWKNITNFKKAFWDWKGKKDIFLQWNKTATSQVTGNVIIINLSCKQKKKPGGYFQACFMFKSAGTQIVTPPPQSITTTKPKKTAKPTITTTTTTIATTIATTKPKTTAKPITTTIPTTQEPKTTKLIATTELSTASSPGMDSTITQKERETTALPGTQTTGYVTSDVTTTEPIEPTEPTEPTEPIEPAEPTEPTELTEPTEPGGAGKLSDKSSEGGGEGTIVTVVAVLCALLAAAALCIITACYLKKRKQRTSTPAISERSIYFENQITDQGKLEDHVYEGQNNLYQLLKRDGKSAEDKHWEQPAYQGLTKNTSEGAWNEGEVYTNPSMYQDLRKNETTSKENLPAYHSLVRQQQTTTTTDTPAYECGYLVLIGEHDKVEKTADTEKENPYYFKVEEHGKVEGTADTNENPYYFKVEQAD